MRVAPARDELGALGTTAVVAVARPAVLARARALLQGELDRIDRACSRFRDDSELSALNRSAGRPVPVGPLLLEAIEVALRVACATGGDVDPTVGRAVVASGYDRDLALLGGRAAPARVPAAPATGWRAVRVDRARATVVLPEGAQLDLGATAKALAADRAAAAIAAATGSGVLVSLGGDIAVAGAPPPGGWIVRVGDDHRHADGDGETIALGEGGLATSGTVARRWAAPDGERHHIVDPRRGRPTAEVWRTVSVAAATCVGANAASTAAIVRGERAPDWLRRGGLPARLVGRDGAVVRVGDWPEQTA